MKEWLQSLFYVPAYGKVTEKALLSRLTVYITAIVLCMAGMAFTAYAYFSYTITSGSNTIQAAYFDVEMEIAATYGAETPLEITRADANTYLARLTAGTTYTVTIKSIGTAETGFVLVSSGSESYHTQQLSKGAEMTFTLTPNADMDIAFLPHWGTSSHYATFLQGEGDLDYVIEAGEEIQITAPAPASDDTDAEFILHIVQAGEYLRIIADHYGTTVQAILDCNEIEDPNLITVGQPIKIPLADNTETLPTEEPTTESTTAPTEAPTTEPTTAPTEEPTTEPTTEATEAPTTAPTAEPTEEPTTAPTTEPTEAPTTEPTTEQAVETTAESAPETSEPETVAATTE